MKIPPAAMFGPLTRKEMDALLARNHVGRLAYNYERVEIEPLHYVYADGVLYCRTSPGSKLTSLQHNRWVAFEVDEIDGLFDWQSVVVNGAVYVVEDSKLPKEHKEHALTVRRLRSLVPDALHDDDPAPSRTVLFRIHIDSMTGRRARSATAPRVSRKPKKAVNPRAARTTAAHRGPKAAPRRRRRGQ